MRLRRRTQLADYRWNDLATYNAEVARGIVHTDEWKAKMAHDQERFNDAEEQRFNEALHEVLAGPKIR